MIGVVALGVVLAIVLGRVLTKAGRPVLDDVFRDRRRSVAVSRLLSVLFYLVAVGSVVLLSTVPMPQMSWLHGAGLKIAILLLVLATAQAVVIGMLLVLRNRRRRRALEDEMVRRVRASRTAQSHQPYSDDRAGF